MDIRPDVRADQLERRRQVERRQTEGAGEQSKPDGKSVDMAKVELDPAAAERFVGMLKDMDPSNLHRVEDLKARIASGDYSADPEELADRLLDALDRGALD